MCGMRPNRTVLFDVSGPLMLVFRDINSQCYCGTLWDLCTTIKTLCISMHHYSTVVPFCTWHTLFRACCTPCCGRCLDHSSHSPNLSLHDCHVWLTQESTKCHKICVGWRCQDRSGTEVWSASQRVLCRGDPSAGGVNGMLAWEAVSPPPCRTIREQVSFKQNTALCLPWADDTETFLVMEPTHWVLQ